MLPLRCMGALRQEAKRAPRCMGMFFAEIGPLKWVPQKRAKPFILSCFGTFLEPDRSTLVVHAKNWISSSGRQRAPKAIAPNIHFQTFV